MVWSRGNHRNDLNWPAKGLRHNIQNILLCKLVFWGFSNSAISWFKSYLSNRSFIVNVENYYADPGDLTCGVPRGSILGILSMVPHLTHKLCRKLQTTQNKCTRFCLQVGSRSLLELMSLSK